KDLVLDLPADLVLDELLVSGAEDDLPQATGSAEHVGHGDYLRTPIVLLRKLPSAAIKVEDVVHHEVGEGRPAIPADDVVLVEEATREAFLEVGLPVQIRHRLGRLL